MYVSFTRTLDGTYLKRGEARRGEDEARRGEGEARGEEHTSRKQEHEQETRHPNTLSGDNKCLNEKTSLTGMIIR